MLTDPTARSVDHGDHGHTHSHGGLGHDAERGLGSVHSHSHTNEMTAAERSRARLAKHVEIAASITLFMLAGMQPRRASERVRQRNACAVAPLSPPRRQARFSCSSTAACCGTLCRSPTRCWSLAAAWRVRRSLRTRLCTCLATPCDDLSAIARRTGREDATCGCWCSRLASARP
jgi:hypothetical protein